MVSTTELKLHRIWFTTFLAVAATANAAVAAEPKPVFECTLTHRFDMFDAAGRETEISRSWLQRAPRLSFDTASGLLRMREASGREIAMLKYRVVAKGDTNNDWFAIAADLPLRWSLRVRTSTGHPYRIMLDDAGMVSIGTCR